MPADWQYHTETIEYKFNSLGYRTKEITDLEQNFLAQWINKQLAFKEAFSNLPNSGNSFSPSQIDAIIALRRKSAEKQSHD